MKQKLIVFVIMIAALLILIFTDWGAQGRVYDCGMAEWHPDIPTEVKEECRRMRRDDFQRQQQQFIERKTIST
jgi:hypothetical protein